MRILKGSLTNLINVLLQPHPDNFIGLSTFQDSDSGGEPGSYLNERVSPDRIDENKEAVMEVINGLQFNSKIGIRNVASVLRDAIQRLIRFKDVGGSILYVMAHSCSQGSRVLETETAELLLNNNIQLVLVESGDLLCQSGSRLARLAGADYYQTDQWKTVGFFRPIHERVAELTEKAITVNRRAVSPFLT